MDEAFAADVEAIRWFAAVGRPLPVGLPFDPLPAAAWPWEGGPPGDPPWDEVQLEAANRLTRFLSDQHRARYRRWNDIAAAVGDRLWPLRGAVWQPFAASWGLDPAFADIAGWDVLHAAMEHEYRDCPGRPGFFLDLLSVYQAGHVPCGWRGGWPAGRLVVW